MHAEKVREVERDRDRERERERERDRQTETETQRQTETKKETERDRQKDRQNLLWSVSCLVEHPAMKPKNRCLHSLLLFMESTWIQSAPAAYAAQTSTQLRHTSFSSVA